MAITDGNMIYASLAVPKRALPVFAQSVHSATCLYTSKSIQHAPRAFVAEFAGTKPRQRI